MSALSLFKTPVAVGKFPSGGFGEKSAHRGFSAGRHSHKHQILFSLQNRPVNPLSLFQKRGIIKKQLRRFGRLGYQHIQSSCRRHPDFLRLTHKIGAQGMVDHIQHTCKVGKLLRVRRHTLFLWEHPHRSGVQKDFRGFPTGVKLFVRNFPFSVRGSGHLADFPGSPVFGNGKGGFGSAAGT